MTEGPSGSWLLELEDAARQVLAPEVYRYISQGAGEGLTTAEANAAWRGYRLLPRVFADVRSVDLGSSLLGGTASMPVGIAPTTFQRAAHPGGEVAMAQACRAAGVPMVLSSNAAASFAEVGEAGATWWLQAYVTEDRDLVVPMLGAAVEAGAAAIVLTVDTPVVATKYDGGAIWSSTPEHWVRANLGVAADARKARDLGPGDISWLAGVTGLPVVVKGVLHPEDATLAVEAGAAGIWVSNHGGRQLDRAVSTARCLVGVAGAIGGAVPVLVDGGIRSGLDVLTALALGADACFLGRLPLYALAVDGSAGVERLLEELRTELLEAFRLVGASDTDALRERVPKPRFGP